MSKTEVYKNIIMPIIARHFPKGRVILYGSRARKDDREGSDIDIALDAGERISSAIMSAIYWDLDESDLPINFDVVDFNHVSEDMKEQIIKYGVIWRT